MKKLFQNLLKSFLTLASLIIGVSCVSAQETTAPRYQEKTPDDTRQLILVYVPVKEKTQGVVTCYGRENANSPWKPELGPMPAQIGRSGLGDPGENTEGNGELPAGEWGLAYAYGFSPEPPKGLKIPYRQITDTDYWVDESNAPEYNYWVSGAEQPAVSHENMTDPVVRYNLGLIMLYNTRPLNPGKGSAFFLHVWLNAEHSTGGCVALSRENVVKLLQWLDQKKNPRIRTQTSPEP